MKWQDFTQTELLFLIWTELKKLNGDVEIEMSKRHRDCIFCKKTVPDGPYCSVCGNP